VAKAKSHKTDWIRWLKPTAIKKKIQKRILLAEANGNKEKKKPEMKVVMENIYCRRFQPTDLENW
jgi:hypothetical protein